jgi:polysaccharide export outer membrane protein
MSKAFALLFFLLCGAPLDAQMESLLIGPGDLLHIQFYDTPELEQHTRVDDAGAVSLLFIGPVTLAGETPGEAAKLIGLLMISKHFMSHPQVLVTIDQYATQEITVSGEVSRPGSYAIATPRSILDVLSLAGGLSPLADRHIVIEHRDGAMHRVNYFVSNDPATQLSDDVKVRPGDIVLIPRVGFVYILGDVGRPGGYPLSSNDSHVKLLQAIINAGSTNKTAIISGVQLMRKAGDSYRQVPIHLGKVEAGKEPDPVLLADDVVIVPFSYVKTFVLNSTAIAASVASAVIYNH